MFFQKKKKQVPNETLSGKRRVQFGSGSHLEGAPTISQHENGTAANLFADHSETLQKMVSHSFTLSFTLSHLISIPLFFHLPVIFKGVHQGSLLSFLSFSN